MMKEFDDNIPERSFDNFQFVNFTEIMEKNTSPAKKETAFALAALMEIPSQYKATLDLGILGRPTGRSPRRVALPPPIFSQTVASSSQKASEQTYLTREPSNSGYTPRSTPSTSHSAYTSRDNQLCPVCLAKEKNMAFNCGHQTCLDCGLNLEICPICRQRIELRVKLY